MIHNHETVIRIARATWESLSGRTDDREVSFAEYPNDATRYAAWCAESVYYCLMNLERDPRPAFRAFLQAYAYEARLDAHNAALPTSDRVFLNPAIRDAIGALSEHYAPKRGDS